MIDLLKMLFIIIFEFYFIIREIYHTSIAIESVKYLELFKKMFQTGRIKSEFFFFHNRKLTSIEIAIHLNKTFFTLFDCDYVRNNCCL